MKRQYMKPDIKAIRCREPLMELVMKVSQKSTSNEAARQSDSRFDEDADEEQAKNFWDE